MIFFPSLGAFIDNSYLRNRMSKISARVRPKHIYCWAKFRNGSWANSYTVNKKTKRSYSVYVDANGRKIHFQIY
jgi:hypothetical protein